MAELDDLYQDLVLEHSKHPRNYRMLESANRSAEGFNPLCGDRLTVYLDVAGETIRDIAFQGSGCAISKASASMMTQTLKGKTTNEADRLFESFHQLVTGSEAEGLGKLVAFAGVARFPARVKCASLPWHTLRAALQGRQQAESTE